ncbi:ATP-grasp domain-containing protein [Paenibacillus hunanensis]|uniref:ATP-grasp domain-containing protein n=1 Tax=Paenibacillus hunanensis TaxID=539262 RepID=UPI00202671D2|nr:ATP-grasp domain-containing protein [Paenibacillus hunanensis]MCL9661057.1 ATP-grasp domain-containing protein [Paenibacillus hunanensis]
MYIVFCSHPLYPKQVDDEYQSEFEACRQYGFTPLLFSFEELMEHNKMKIYPQINMEPQEAMYRGWMVTIEQYTLLYEKLKEKNIHLLTSPTEYANIHYFPNAYSHIKQYTPLTTWISKEHIYDEALVLKQTAIFGDSAMIVKDYVKSRKHEWDTACYVPNAEDTEKVLHTVRNVIRLQGEALNGGIMFRQFIELESIGIHEKSGMPLSREFRIFYFNQQPVLTENYWEEIQYEQDQIPLSFFNKVAKDIPSSFFTMDIARTINNEWIIIEVGDGQVSGLPSYDLSHLFYRKLASKV